MFEKVGENREKIRRTVADVVVPGVEIEVISA
jgi:hypothetical protein